MQVNLFPLFDRTADFQAKKNAADVICTNFREVLLVVKHRLYVLIRSPKLRQIDFELQQVRAAGGHKALGCVAQHKWRCRRAVIAANFGHGEQQGLGGDGQGWPGNGWTQAVQSTSATCYCRVKGGMESKAD